MRRKKRGKYEGRLYNGLPLVLKYDAFDTETEKEVSAKLREIAQAVPRFISVPNQYTITTLKRPRITGYRRDEMSKRIDKLEKEMGMLKLALTEVSQTIISLEVLEKIK